MRKILSFLLAVYVVLSLSPVGTAEGWTIGQVSLQEGGVFVELAGPFDEDVRMVVAAYTSDQQLLRAAERTIPASEEPVTFIAIDLSTDDAAYVTAYLLTDENMRPLCAKRSGSDDGTFVDLSVLSYYYALAAARRDAILSSETSIVKSDVFIPGETYTGTAYYVSSSQGNDENDGLSPETPWKTLERVHQGEWDGDIYEPGDIVFFKRGDTWRGNLWCKEGVTFSAYGEGPKPVIMGSPENGADSDKWELYYQDDSGKKIWKFYQNLHDTGGIIFNEGESYATRAYGWWDGEKYINVDFVQDGAAAAESAMNMGWTITTDWTEQSPENCLDDLQMCIMVDYTGKEFPVSDQDRTGPLYLRCDQGNPGEIFDSIEFASKPADYPFIVICQSDCVIDNLSIKYWGSQGISASPYMENIVVQNCEVAWGFCTINNYVQPEPTMEYMLINDGIYGQGRNGIIRNNYTHDMDAVGITFETYSGNEPGIDNGENSDTADPPEFYRCTGNLIERCGSGIILNDQGEWFDFQEIVVSDNYIFDIGPKSSAAYANISSSLSLGNSGFPTTKSFDLSGNIFCRSDGYLLIHANPQRFPVEAVDNVYIQDAGARFAIIPEWYYDIWYTTDADLKEKIGENISFDPTVPETLLIAVG